MLGLLRLLEELTVFLLYAGELYHVKQNCTLVFILDLKCDLWTYVWESGSYWLEYTGKIS